MFIKKTEQQRFDELYKTILKDGKILYIGYLLQRAAHTWPTHNALLYQETAITYKELYCRAVVLSKLLLERGVKPRDRVLLLIENSPEFYCGYFAILQVGAVVAPLNVFLKERELAHIITDSQASLIITSKDFLPLLSNAAVTLPPIITQEDIPAIEIPAELPAFDVKALEPEELAALLYTSGTTGFPKGVMLSSKNAMTSVIQGMARFDLNSTDRIFCVLPLFHSFAQNTCIWVPMFTGCTVILVRKIDRRSIVEGLEKKPTLFLGVPALYGFLALLKTAQFPAVRCFVSGADALPDKIRAAFELLYRRKICSGYGLTEASPFVAGGLEDETVLTSSVGKPVVGLEWSVKNEEGVSVAPGTVGELWIKGDNIMLGYYNEPQMTRDVMVNGWLRTGDLVYVDKNDRLIISGRIKDIIKHKGLIIYPPEVENVITGYPNVLRVAVLGKIDAESGEIPVAFVQVRHEEPGIEKALRVLCMKNCASYKVPRDFICSTQELPMTATGKVDKKKLRADLAAQQ